MVHTGILPLGIVLTLALLLALTPGALAYNRDAASEYADEWTEDDPNSTLHNPDYPYYDGHDCANYVSQCLIEGGLDLSAGTDGYGTGVVSGCIPNCDNLHTHLVEYQRVEHHQISTSESLPNNLQAGDVIIFGDETDEWQHAVIVVGGSGNNVELNAHTNHRSHRPFSFYASSSTVAHIYHFPTAAETGHAQEYFGTGGFYGERALQVAIYESGQSYEGYILSNTDPAEQDMAIGEDTSSYPGCSYYVEGYCCDAHEGVPSHGVEFGQPWTCDSPEHWAYWVREAIKFANQHDYSEGYTLDAVWYISDRSGPYNGILSSIGYPENGPNKNVDVSYYIKGHVSDVDGESIGGVSVTLSGDISWTLVTDATGYFEFLYLPEGSYAITIDNAGLTSNPPIREYNPLDANQEDQDFTVVSGGLPLWVWLIVGGVIVVVIIVLVGAILWYVLARRHAREAPPPPLPSALHCFLGRLRRATKSPFMAS